MVLVLGLLSFVFFKNNSKENGSSSENLTVFINDEGFFPDKIITTAGSTIAWVNQGERLHWPASNFHPSHTLYPEPGGCLGSKFDACKGLEKGESFSFRLEKPGIWPMHDHLFPSLVMTVEVLKKGEERKSSFSFSENTSVLDFRNFDYGRQIEFVKLLSQENPKDGWNYIKEAFIVNGQVVGNAHEFAHVVGNLSYKKSGLEGIKICDTAFAFGCFHGVTEAMLLNEGTNKIKDIEIECLELFPSELTEGYTGCIHGTGHGIYTWENGNLNQALSDCDILTERYRQYCYDGVFMENVSSSSGGFFEAKNPWKFCTDLDERYHRNCARYQSQVFLGGALNGSLVSVGKNCSLGPHTLLRETCYESLGYYVAQTSLGKASIILEQCGQMPSTEGVEICTIGGAVESIFQKYGDFKNSANMLCEKLGERRLACLERIKIMLKQYAI